MNSIQTIKTHVLVLNAIVEETLKCNICGKMGIDEFSAHNLKDMAYFESRYLHFQIGRHENA